MPSALDLIGHDDALKEHWVKRLIAIIIDSVILSITVSVITFFAPFDFWVGFLGFWALFYFVYFVAIEMAMGASIGKQLMKMRVIALSGELDIGKVIIRNVSKLNGLLLLLDFIVGFISDGDPKQKFLDRIAGTTVIITDIPLGQSQNIYQSQQQQYAPPPQQQYPEQHTPIYHQPQQTAPQPPPPPPEQTRVCSACQGGLILTGDGRQQCMRCGRIY